MAKKSQSASPAAAAEENDNNSTDEAQIGKENNIVITPEVMDAMHGRSLVGMDGRKRRIHVDTQESGYTTSKPDPEDVLLGRGRPIQNHPGNQHMLRLVQQYREEYDAISRAEKYKIVEDIMGAIKAKGGRFMDHVEQVDGEGQPIDYWKEVSRSNAYNKVTHAFRSLRRQNLPPEQRPQRAGAKKSKAKSIAAAAANPGMASMMHGGMMGYGPPPPGGAYPPMMNPADMGMHPGFMPTPWGAVPMDMQHALWAQQQSLMGGGAPPPAAPADTKAAAPADAAETPPVKEEESSKNVYEV